MLSGDPNQKSTSRLWAVAVLIFLLAASGAILFRQSISTRKAPSNPPVEVGQPVTREVIRIAGMDCLMCAAGLQSKLRSLPGVKKAEVSFQDNNALVEYDPGIIGREKLVAVIQGDGFKVAPMDGAPSTGTPHQP